MTASKSWRNESRELLSLAWPVVIAQLGMMMMGVVDVIMVGHLSADALAVVALGHGYSNAMLMPLFGIAIGLDPFFSQAFGAKDRSAAGKWFIRGLLLMSAVAIPVSLAHLFSAQALTVANQPIELIPTAAEYVEALVWSVPALVLFAIMRKFLQGDGMVREATIAVLLANFINFVADYALIYGELGAPQMGALGSAWATVGSRFFMMGVIWWFGVHKLKPSLLGLSEIFALAPFKRLVWVSVPTAVQISLEVWAFIATTMMAGWLGSTALAAHTVVLNLASVTYMIPLGVATAATVRVGNLIGAKKPWRDTALASIGIGVLIMSASALLLLSFPSFWARLYTDDVDVIAVAVVLFPIAGLFQVFDGIQVVVFGNLRGAGDTRVPPVAFFFAFWVIGLPCSYYLAFVQGMGTAGIWYGLVVGLTIVSILLSLRLRSTLNSGGFRVG